MLSGRGSDGHLEATPSFGTEKREAQPAWASELRRFRRLHALKQMALAEMMGVDQTTISRWESGQQTPDLPMQRRLRDLIRQRPSAENLLKHSVAMALGQVVLAGAERIILAASKSYSRSHGIPHDEIRGMSTRPMYSAEGEAIWQQAYESGFYKGEIASVTLVSKVHSLSGHVRDRCTKVVWTPLQMGDGRVFRHSERVTLAEDEFPACRGENGGPIRIVTMESLVA